MKFCQKCGKEIADDAKFCDSCGAPIEMIESQLENGNESNELPVEEIVQESVMMDDIESVESATNNSTNSAVFVQPKRKIKISKTLWIVIVAIVFAILIAVVAITNSVKLNKYKTILEDAYNSMSYGAEQAEDYSSLQSKVWRNCIMEDSSIETDKYTKNQYGSYYSDFNDALQEFYDGEYLTYSTVSSNVNIVNNYMSKLKECPDKFEDEYRALKEMYVAYSDLTDLVVGSSSYSLNSFSEALENAKSNYKTAKSAASLMIG